MVIEFAARQPPAKEPPKPKPVERDIEMGQADQRWRAKRGRPKLEAAKVAVTLRLDPDLVELMQASSDWRAEVNQYLREKYEI